MADIVSRERRSEIMTSIRSKNTTPEVFFRKKLFHMGYRYSLHTAKIEGHPDLFVRKYNTAVFVNGCFWHRHPGCKYSYIPKSNLEFWERKFKNNVARDAQVKMQLYEKGVKCLVIWECQIKQMMKSAKYEQMICDKIALYLGSSSKYMEI